VKLDLDDGFAGSAIGGEARQIIGRCVHCGFCTAACPTYRLSGDELEGPRGRIYLIKQALEGAAVGEVTRTHLDSCLTCRACETACPSGVEYGRLIEIGREVVARQAPAPWHRRMLERLLVELCSRPRLFALFLWSGRLLRPLLPRALAGRIPSANPQPSPPGSSAVPATRGSRRVILLEGCVQPALLPGVNAAARRVLARCGIETVVAPQAGCCGALRLHGGDTAGGLGAVRRNVDAWWPLVEAGADALVMTASGCGVTVRDYGRLLRDDPAYATRAARLAAMTRDLVEVIDAANVPAAPVSAVAARVAFHPPCTLQHGQRLGGRVESVLRRYGAELSPVADLGQCCGSAGAYSILHPVTAAALRERKLDNLVAGGPREILSANVGCIAHLAVSSPVRVRHWIEWLDERLAAHALVGE
jgi:glycolate oxidase iron-sulfur subunit